jgi:nicotinate phosphoribosyltransferase
MLSILDNDLYKFKTQWAIIQNEPEAIVRYKFVDRKNTYKWTDKALDQLRNKIHELSNLTLADDCNFSSSKLSRVMQLPEVYIKFLEHFNMPKDSILVSRLKDKLELTITGYWWETVLWEVPILAAISEIMSEESSVPSRIISRAEDIINSGIYFSEFGTRRRESQDSQSNAISTCRFKHNCLGTSNVYLANKFDITAIGSQPHEWYMYHAAEYGYNGAYFKGIDSWIKTFKNSESEVLLPDTFSTEKALDLSDQGIYYNFCGIRQDSGNPFEVMEMFSEVKSFWRGNKIIFSDGINNVDTAKELETKAVELGLDPSFGIGTYLTNSSEDPPNIVIKLSDIWSQNINKWIPTVKLSDSPGKYFGPESEIERCKQELEI